MKKIVFLAILFLFSAAIYCQQIDPKNISIVRDSFGVPHIFAKTDAEVAYGLAWAHCEDNFHDIQLNGIGGRGRRGEVEGKDGVIFDFALKFLGIDTLVDNRYDSDFSPEFKKVIEAYVQGVNDYAYKHPEEMMLKKLLPFTKYDIIKGYCITTTLLSGVGYAIKAIRSEHVDEYMKPNEKGSNSICISPSRTEDQKAWLLVNSHQPLEGPYAWYEAHLSSEEGWNVIGGLFPGGIGIFVGCNPNLGWAHTNNFHSFGDVYTLQTKGHKYFYDGQYVPLQFKKIPLKVRLGYVTLAVKKKVAYCDYGPVYKYKGVSYALRFPSYTNIKGAEQWYKMNKSRNFEEFEACMKMDALAMFNTLYADIDGNIYYHSAGMMPQRDPSLNWKNPIQGISSKYKWTQLLPYEKKVTYKNPSCGYLYNANNTPLHASGTACNWSGEYYPGLQLFEYNRGERLHKLFTALDNTKISWEDFRRIKFDKSYDSSGSYADRFKAIYSLDAARYPKISDAIQLLKRWNFDNDINNREASLALVVHHFLQQKIKEPFGFLMIREKKVSETEAVWAISEARKFLLKTQHMLNPPLGDIQRLIRGNVSIPASGSREVLRAADAKLYDEERGVFRISGGDAYMQMVKLSKTGGVEIQSITAYGSSSRPWSKHYTDQMRSFQRQEFKSMTFDRSLIFSRAEKIYFPGQINY